MHRSGVFLLNGRPSIVESLRFSSHSLSRLLVPRPLRLSCGRSLHVAPPRQKHYVLPKDLVEPLVIKKTLKHSPKELSPIAEVLKSSIRINKIYTSGTGMASSSPLVWIDCEMTGLDVVNDTIIEVCCYITDSNLKLLTPEPFNVVINKPKEVMDGMDDWCVNTHGKSGLTAEVLASSNTTETVRPALMAFIKQHVPYERYGILAGNSVHADRMFLAKEFPEVVSYLHYRIMDVSTIKEGVKMWCSSETLRKIPGKKCTHRAKDDILESIEELRTYKKLFFDGK